jgi:hypothetical protein
MNFAGLLFLTSFYQHSVFFNTDYFQSEEEKINFMRGILLQSPKTTDMKKISTLFISCLLCFIAGSQTLKSRPTSSDNFKVLIDYGLGLPQQQMGSNIQSIHNLHIGGLYQLPNKLKNLSVGLELGAGMYAHEKIDQTFNFDANTSTTVPVNYNSNVVNANVQARYQLLDDNRLIVPYISAKAGLYNFYSNITIENPDDPDGCQPLDKKNLINDKTLYWGAGAGFQIDPSIFSRRKRDGPVKIDLSVNTIYGGKLDYINTKHLKDEQDMPNMGGKPLMVKFINASTQDIHQHKVAQVYTSALRVFEIRGGVVMRLGRF